MTDADSGADKQTSCWKKLIGIVLSIVATLWWLTLRPAYPTCTIQEFYVPALDKALNYNTTNTNTSIYFEIELDNKQAYEGIYFNTLDFTFYYDSNQTRLPVANQTFPGFHQGHKKKASRTGTVEAVGVPWGEVFGLASNGSKPVFRVGLVASLRFKVLTRMSRTREWVIGADVAVNDKGEKDEKKGVNLKSGAPGIRCGRTGPMAIGAIILFYLLF